MSRPLWRDFLGAAAFLAASVWMFVLGPLVWIAAVILWPWREAVLDAWASVADRLIGVMNDPW